MATRTVPPQAQAVATPIRGQSFSIAASAFIPSDDIPNERSNGRYVREMLFEGFFIIFMIALVLAVSYFAVYYIGYGETMEKNGIDFIHQWLG